MKRFPSEFADLLSPAGRRILDGANRGLPEFFRGDQTPIVLLRNMIDSERAVACQRLLDRALYEHVRTISAPIPAETITGMTRNYEERLPKAVHLKTVHFERRNSAAARAADSIGLLEMMSSQSFAAFAEAVTGYRLWPESGKQAILYEHGDYSGPHNDHHPELEEASKGYIDLHITFCNDAVAHHWLVYEEEGHLSRIEDVSISGAVALYRLPFWHYTTPLVGKRNRVHQARRWLLLGSFNIDWENSEAVVK